jgi:molecular chaperone Hsp33
LQDALHRYLFENAAIRGEHVHLEDTWRAVLQRHEYPPVLRTALGEMMAAAALLAATLKLQGSLLLQIQGNGPVSLLVVECDGDLAMRATAKWKGELPQGGLTELVGTGRFAITLDPKDGSQPYQGIVALEGGSIAEILENYMTRSEQLETRLWLAADDGQAAGLLLQKLPGQPEQDADAWGRLGHLAATVQPHELLKLPAETLLRRLFHEEDVRLFSPQPVTFHCRCSRTSVANMLKLLGREEVESILEERGNVEVNCEFCNQRYEFDAVDTEEIFASAIPAPGSESRH